MSQIRTIESLKNHFLIAMPALNDDYFARSVTLIIEHTQDGAMGIIVNQPSSMSMNELIQQSCDVVDLDEQNKDKIVVCGGPVNPDHGFVLHTNQTGWSSSIRVDDNTMLTSSKDILYVLGKEKGPVNAIVALGYAGWEAGQLEREIQENVWLTIEADQKILFDTPIHEKWQAAVNKLGVDVWQLTQQSGQA